MSERLHASPAAFMATEVISKERIEREAKAAAARGDTLTGACPYPFGSEAERHFTAHFLVAQPRSQA